MRASDTNRSYYLGSLDGLRMVAFLTVFLHHLPAPANIGIFTTHGWIGVDLFFVISAYLLFTLLAAEKAKEGAISTRNFYLRRILRIYPLLVVFYVVMFIVGAGFADGHAWLRLAGTMASVDNLVVWVDGYNFSVPAVGPLWTLSYEFQVYLLLPIAFLAWQRWGTRTFLVSLLVIELMALGGRWLAVEAGSAGGAGFYVTPYLRPESILLGLALAAGKPKWHPAWSLLIAIGAGFVFAANAPHSPVMASYVPGSIMAAALVDAGIRWRPLQATLAWRPFRYLGTISYGLYVFHVATIWTTVKLLTAGGLVSQPLLEVLIPVVALALTVATAAISYRYLEKPFLRIKLRYTSVDGRASAEASATAATKLSRS